PRFWVGVALLTRAEFTQIQTGTKRFPFPPNDDDANSGVSFELGERLGQPVKNNTVECIPFFRSIQCDGCDTMSNRTENFGHGCLLIWLVCGSHKPFLPQRSR